MRIIAGALKGRVLAPVQGRTRPTAARVREAIFNILGAAVLEARVLDLFAGTGALGIEALSRGAAAAVFVEDHPEALKGLRRNLETLGLVERSQVLPWPVAACLNVSCGCSFVLCRSAWSSPSFLRSWCRGRFPPIPIRHTGSQIRPGRSRGQTELFPTIFQS